MGVRLSGRDGALPEGDVLLLTRDAWANALRYCDFDRPVQFLPTGNAIYTFGSGIWERR